MLNTIGPAGLLIMAVVILILFGRGRVAALMGEVGTGISSLRRSLSDPSQIDTPSEISRTEQKSNDTSSQVSDVVLK